MKAPRGSVGLAAVNGRLHAIGGRDVNRVTVNTHEIYDPAGNRWTDAPPLPQPRDHTYTVAVGRDIHVIGGRLNTPVENVNTHDIFDTRTNAWRTGPPLPTPRSGGGAVVYKGMIVVLGGECDNGRPFTHNEAFDPRTNRWTTLAPMPSGRHGIMAAADARAIYIPGGAPACATAQSNNLQIFTLP
jgi:N-acetylneuraminic acid mutarotase